MSDYTCGRARVQAELVDTGLRVNHKRDVVLTPHRHEILRKDLPGIDH